MAMKQAIKTKVNKRKAWGKLGDPARGIKSNMGAEDLVGELTRFLEYISFVYSGCSCFLI